MILRFADMNQSEGSPNNLVSPVFKVTFFLLKWLSNTFLSLILDVYRKVACFNCSKNIDKFFF